MRPSDPDLNPTRNSPAQGSQLDEMPSTQPNSMLQQAPMASQTTLPTKKKRKKLVIGSVVALIVVALITTLTLGYFLWYQNPDRVVYNGIARALNAQTVLLEGSYTFRSKDVTIDVTSKSERVATSGTLDATAKITLGDPSITIEVGSSMRVRNGTLYFKIDGLRETANTVWKEYAEDLGVTAGRDPFGEGYIGSIIEKIDGRWVAVTPSDLEGFLGEGTTDEGGIGECFADALRKFGDDNKYRAEVVDAYKDNQFVSVVEQLGIKDINGKRSAGYQVEFDQSRAEQFTRALRETQFGRDLKDCDDEFDLNELADSMARESSTESQASDTTEVWVDRFSHDITQVNVSDTDEDGVSATMTVHPVFSGDVQVEIPEDAISFDELIKSIQEMMLEMFVPGFEDAQVGGGGLDLDALRIDV